MKTRSLRLCPVASLAALVGDGTLVAFGVGPNGIVYLAFALKSLDYRTEGAGSVSFAKTIPNAPQHYRVIGLLGPQPVIDVAIRKERFNIHHVQPLPCGLLLACARSHYNAPDEAEKNGRVYSLDGTLTAEILLGDGIQGVQATSQGMIWTSYFDEGIFGNYGWLDPIGASGLVAWDPAGGKIYEFQPGNGLDAICDCYAMNVTTDEDVWCYYYTEFPLVHLHRRKVESVWRMRLAGSDAFAISSGHALFRGGYKDRNTYHLFTLGSDGVATLAAKLDLRDEHGRQLKAERVVGRGDAIYLISDDRLYRLDVAAAVRSFC